MIEFNDNIFYLQTRSTSYWFQITAFGHLEHLYYGPFLKRQGIGGLQVKRTAIIGSSVVYDAKDPLYCLDVMGLEYSGMGKGDYRFSPCELKMPDGTFMSDFVYQSHAVVSGKKAMDTLPSAIGSDAACDTLEITLKDTSNQTELILVYTVFANCDVITRRAMVKNSHEQPLTVRRLMSLSVDIPNRQFSHTTLSGGWIKETHVQTIPLHVGRIVNASTTGSSSNQHNPGVIISEQGCTQDHGWAYGFNLVYSGNHFSCVERNSHDLVRITMGINSEGFEWTLQTNEIFQTPEAILTFSDQGTNGVSRHFHDFINRHIIPVPFQAKLRPIAYNNWEATFFKFNEKKLLGLAKKAKQLGVELFVLDDGWFGSRNSDTKGLGDYQVNAKKFPQGLKHFVDKLNQIGLEAGIWFEPEMVNEDSDLFRKHPEYILKVPGKKPTTGRNQYVLDLCNPAVCDTIVNQVTQILDSCNITYVKWDMNRHIAECYSPHVSEQGRTTHQYIINLYRILDRIFGPRPHILLETCSSGGNRFDLGMLCFGPQIWASDNTDPIERLDIQEGLSYFYPLSTISAHVSGAPHQQTLRDTPLSTRFNVASFGVLGYELDLDLLNVQENKEIKEQIAFYKQYRYLIQYGTFYRSDGLLANRYQWQVVDDSHALVGWFQNHVQASPPLDRMQVKHLDPDRDYHVRSKPQRLMISRFGDLIKHVAPVHLDPRGIIMNQVNKVYSLQDSVEVYHGSGSLLAAGIYLNNQFMGSHYNDKTRLLGDFGSTLFVITPHEGENHE